MVDFMIDMEWDYLTLLHSDDDFSKMGVQMFKELATDGHICIQKTLNTGNMVSAKDALLSSRLAESPTGVVYLGDEINGNVSVTSLCGGSMVGLASQSSITTKPCNKAGVWVGIVVAD